MRCAIVRAGLGALALSLFLAIPAVEGFATEGGGRSGIENLSFLKPSRSRFSVFHLDAWQNLPNTGRLQFSLDWANGINPIPVNWLGSVSLDLAEYQWSRWTLDATAGDSRFRFTNLRQKFANAFYLDVYVRGGQARISGPRGELSVFGGRVTRLEGLTGISYALTGESLYGFKGRQRLGKAITVGAGFLRTENESDETGAPLSKNNNILLFDSEARITPELTWITELRASDFQAPAGGRRTRDLNLRLGTIYGSDPVHLEANYRYAGAGYHFVSRTTQSERNQQELFIQGRVAPAGWLSLFGHLGLAADTGRDGFSFLPVEDVRDLIGFSITPRRGPTLHVSFDTFDRRPKLDSPFRSDYSLSSLQGELHFGGTLDSYIRVRRFLYDDRLYPQNAYDQATAILGFRRAFRSGLMAYAEGEGERLLREGGSPESRATARAGFGYYSASGFSVWAEGSYFRAWAAQGLPPRNYAAAFFGMSGQLLKGFRYFVDIRYDQTFETIERLVSPPGLRLTFRIMKTFNWGEPVKPAGFRSGASDARNGSISGSVFSDDNGNGVMDPGEKGLPRFSLRLEDGSTVETAADGSYRFPRVAVGDHILALDARRIPIEYNILGPGEQRVTVAFRSETLLNFRVVAGAKLSGQVVFDENGNGRADATERGLPDVLVYLLPGGEVNTFTNADGDYDFENLDPGEYTVTIDARTLPEGVVVVPPAEFKRSIAPGETAERAVFLVKPKAVTIRMTAGVAPVPSAGTPAKPKSVLPAGAGRIDAIVVKGETGGFAVQAGSFSSPEKAADLQNRLSRTYKGVTVTEFKKSGETVYRVRIKASSKPAALQIVRALANEAPIATGAGLTARKK